MRSRLSKNHNRQDLVCSPQRTTPACSARKTYHTAVRVHLASRRPVCRSARASSKIPVCRLARGIAGVHGRYFA